MKEILEPNVCVMGKVMFDTENNVVIIDMKTRTYYFFNPCKVTPLLMDGCDAYDEPVQAEDGKITFNKYLGGPGAHERAKVHKRQVLKKP